MAERRRLSEALTRALVDPARAPLKRQLLELHDEERELRMWHGIERRAAQQSRSRAPWLLAVAFACACIALSFWPKSAPGPLRLGSDAMPSELLGKTSEPFALSDGSRIFLPPGSRLEVLRNDGQALVVGLRRGESTFDVQPGGPRRWTIETGLASVEVVGTRFTVLSSDRDVSVRVARGVVLVRGATVAGGLRRLTAGESLIVGETTAGASAPESPAPTASVASAATAAAKPSVAGAARSVTPRTAQSANTPDALDALLASADQARRRGDDAQAVAELERVLTLAAPNDPRRGLAALSIARLTGERDPARAAEALSQVESGMPQALAEDALARNIEALRRAGQTAQARALANEYLRRFPHGQRADEVKRWLSP